MRFGISAALLAVLALVLPAFASADPLGSSAFFSSVLRETAFINVLTAGPDGNVWFVDSKVLSGTSVIGRITPSGVITEYISGAKEPPKLTGLNAGSDPVAIAAGPGGEKYLWFTDKGSTPAIGFIDSASPETATEISAGLNAGSKPQGIVAGPDGNLWFADLGTTSAIGVVNPSTKEVVKECSAGLNAGSKPQGIVAGPDGNLWFTDKGTTSAIGRINPSNCEITEFTTEGGTPGGNNSELGPWGIAAGPDGNVWFNQGQAVKRITPSGEITSFSEGLIASSFPYGLTAAAGKLWFTDKSGVDEKQELVIEDPGTLGGTYKLGFKGQETGAKGKGNLLSSAKGKGDVKRYPTTGNATCLRTSGTEFLETCNNEPSVKAEVGMRITGTGIPVETLITKIEGTTIFLSKKITGAVTKASTTNINAGRVANVSKESGEFELGQTVTGTGLSGTIFAVEEKEGKVTGFALTATPTAVGTGVALTASTTTVVTGVTTSTGAFSVGEQIEGAGIPAATTITAINTALKTLTLSATPTEAGTGVSLSADLGFSASGTAVAAALQKLPVSPSFENVGGNGEATTPPIKRTIAFEGAAGATNVEQLSCNGAGLTGTSPTCTVTTTTTGVPNAVGSITTSGKITRYPLAALNWGTTLGITNNGGEGNVWISTGFTTSQKIGKFGIESPEKELTIKKIGAGSGTVTSSPAGINCGSECIAKFEEGEEVTLTPSPESGSEFRGWSGACSGIGSCKVTMSEAKEVTAFFSHAKQVLTVAQEGTGAGTISSKPKAVKCATACTKAVASLYKGTTVLLTAKAASGSKLSSWSGCESETKSELEGTCTVKMSAAKEVKAVFGGTYKAILNPKALTVAKATGTGKGTVKATGLTCEADCASTAVKYTGGDGGKKLPAKVVLTEIPAAGSSFAAWTGCEEIVEGKCVVTTSSAKEVTARFSALANKTLTVAQEGTGVGTISSKPKGVKCATACTSAVASLPEGTTVLLTAKAASGSKLSSWSGCESETKSELEGTCTVKMSAAKEVKAVFGGTAKAILNPKVLTVSKAGTGYGTVKATGLTCEVACTSTAVKYTGGDGGKKLPATVTLTATPQAGSDPVDWEGCESEPEGKCVVSMSKAQSVTATFEE